MAFEIEDDLPESPSGEVVHWMAPRRSPLAAVDISPSAVAAFALGVGVTVGVWAALSWLAPRREGLPPWRWRRGALH